MTELEFRLASRPFAVANKNKTIKLMQTRSLIQKAVLGARKFIPPMLVGIGLLAGAILVQGGETVPYKSKVSGHLTFNDSGGFTIEETGIGTHLGNFSLVGETDPDGILWFTLTAANGDQVVGFLLDAAEDLAWVELVINGGSGRFEGATGHITGIVTMDWSTGNYTAVGTGSITTVGPNKH
jgi:hypothetical protein